MTSRVSIVALSLGVLLASTLIMEAKRWNPATAVSDARRAIAEQQIRFCYIGGYVPHPIGVPDGSYRIVSRYPRIEVGDQGCILSKHSETEHEYARLYNEEMWRHVSRKPR
jgi:hypothetical protein